MRRERSRGGSQRRHHLLQRFLHVSHAYRCSLFSRTSPSPSLSASQLLLWVPVVVASPPSSLSSNVSIVPTLAPSHSVVISSNRWIWTGTVVCLELSIRSQWCSLEPFVPISSWVWRERWQMESWRRRCVLNYQRDARSIRYRSGSSGKGGVGRSEAAFGVFVIHRSSFWARLRVRWTARIRIRSWRRWRRGERLICEWWHIV